MSAIPITATFTYNAATSEPPTGNQVRLDVAAPYTGVSKLWIRDETVDGRDLSPLLRRILPGSAIYLQDRNDSTRALVVDVTAAPIDKIDYLEVAVVLRERTGDLISGQQADLYAEANVGSDAPAVTGSGTPGHFAQWVDATVIGDAPVLVPEMPPVVHGIERFVTLEQAKAHLGITTPPGHVDDPRLQLQLDGAQFWVLGYVGRTVAGQTIVATWVDPLTTPADVQAAVLILVAEFWRFRGDDLEDAGPPRCKDTDAPPVVLGLLRRYGGPVLV